MQQEVTASPLNLIPVLAALRARRVDPAPLLAELGVDESRLEHSGLRVDNARLLAAWECARALGGDNIGLEAVAFYRPGMFHVVEYLIVSAPTLRQGIEMGARHLRLLNDVAHLALHDDGDLCQIRFSAERRIPVPRAEMEFYVACTARICARALGIEQPFASVDLPHPAPADRTVARRALRAPVRYDASHANLNLASAQVDRPSVTADAGLHALLREHGRLLLDQRSSEECFRLRVRHLVATVFPEVLSLEEAAHRLRVSSRTLRRRLADEGTSYRAVVDDVRLETAARLLRDHQLSLEEAASRLGFTSASTLARAFRRWAGITPARFRADAP